MEALGQVGEQEAEEALKQLEVPKARYVMEVDRHYIVSYGCNNPAGLANDAGDYHRNVTSGGGGKMEAIRYIEIGEEIYWCYGSKYWGRGKPRLPLPRAIEGGGGTGGPGIGQGGEAADGGGVGTVGSGGGNDADGAGAEEGE